jgi:hypothetical protein
LHDYPYFTSFTQTNPYVQNLLCYPLPPEPSHITQFSANQARDNGGSSSLSCTKKIAEIKPETDRGKSLGKSTDVEQAKSPTEDLRSPVFQDLRASLSSPFEPHARLERLTDNSKAVEGQESEALDLGYRRADDRECCRVLSCSQELAPPPTGESKRKRASRPKVRSGCLTCKYVLDLPHNAI